MTEESPKPEITQDPDGYHLTWPTGIEAAVERLAEHRDELTAELTIRSTRQPRPGLLHRARANLMSSQTRRTLATALERREPDLDWQAMLEQLCFLVVERYRTGEPAVDLRESGEGTGVRWLLEPFIERSGPTVLFAAGGTGKSMLALAMAVSVASGHPIIGKLAGEGGPVLYCDWETDQGTANERMRAISAGAGLPTLPPVFYRRCVASLMESAPEIRREIARTKAVMVVVDSFGAARGGEPESADVTIKAMNAGRSLGVPWIAVDHVTKALGNDATQPFGSAFTHNLARVTWSMAKGDDEADHVIALKMRKSNNGRFRPTMGYRVVYESDEDGMLWSVQYHQVDPGSDPALAKSATTIQRIEGALRAGGRTRKELSEDLEIPLNVVTARVYEMLKRGKLAVKEDGSDGRVWLASRDN